MVSRVKLAKAALSPKGAKKSTYPGFVEPTLATLRAAPPTGANWIHEIKFDGYRVQAQIRRRGVKLLTRSGLDWTVRFGAVLASALADLMVDEAVIDGEVVAETGNGVPVSQRCKTRLRPVTPSAWYSTRSISSTSTVMICAPRR